MTDVRILLSKNMKNFREIMNISQMELAEKVGCSPTLIGKIESTKRFPSADNINRIAIALGVTPADLFLELNNSEVSKSVISKQKRKKQLIFKINDAIEEYFL